MQLIHNDCLEVELSGITAVVTDPPYGLEFMGEGWDKGVPGVQFWQHILGMCLPGAMLVAFGGTRTHHRLVCAIEDAGWQIRDCVMWLYGSGFPKSHDISKATDDAKTWNGYGTALKPAYEPICIAMKPLDGTFANNAIKHGVAGINVDGCRVKHDEPIKTMKAQSEGNLVYRQSGRYETTTELKLNGRWPANVIHDGSDEVVGEFPSPHGAGKERMGGQSQQSGEGGSFGVGNHDGNGARYGDEGSAARFFYCAKVSSNERGWYNWHPTVKPIALMRYLLKLVTMPENNLILDPFMGSGTTAVACDELGLPFIGIEKNKGHFNIVKRRMSK